MPNFTGVAARRLYVVAIQLPGAVGTAFRVIGHRTADSSLEFNTSIETSTDILGETFTDVQDMQENQAFEFPITADDPEIWQWVMDVYRRGAYNEYAGITALQIHAFEGMVGAYEAVRFDHCTIEPTSFGGPGEEGRLMLSITFHFGGTRTQGTADRAVRGVDVTFVPAV